MYFGCHPACSISQHLVLHILAAVLRVLSVLRLVLCILATILTVHQSTSCFCSLAAVLPVQYVLLFLSILADILAVRSV